MNRISKDDSFEVSDPTDWITTPLPTLSEVDSALRCQVCKDFYTTPMTTSCSHTFCSLCIRRSLHNDGKCPACRTPDQELKLRFNGALEDVVEAFKRARPQVMQVATKPAQVSEPISPKRKRYDEQTKEETMPRKKTRTSGRRTRSSQTEVVVMDSAGEEDDDYIPEDGLVQCPVCQKRVKETAINVHLDQNCTDEPKLSKTLDRSNKQTALGTPGPLEKSIKRLDRLPQLNYQFVKDPALKKKLTDLGLSAAGPRSLLERRYTEWVTLWNANCDATRPKSKSELKRELDIWDRTLGKNTASVQGAQIKDKDFNGKAWSDAHDSDFKDLIAKARAKAQKLQNPSSTSTSTPAPKIMGSSTPNPIVPLVEAPSLPPPMDTRITERAFIPDESEGSGNSITREEMLGLEDYRRPRENPAQLASPSSSSSQHRIAVTLLEKNAAVASDVPISPSLQP